MGTETKVLDHGYVRLIETWGSDERIIEAARMSTNKGFQGWGPLPCKSCDGDGYILWDLEDRMLQPCEKCHSTGEVQGDEKLLRYLWAHNHHTPFEMAGMTIEVQAPIFVFREWHRHRTQSFNELSARYTELPDLYYIPSIERLQAAKPDPTNKQGSIPGGMSEHWALSVRDIIQTSTNYSRSNYESLLSAGVAREVARVVVPVNQYSRMRASANLRNWLHFATLRRPGGGAQWEIAQYAQEVINLIEKHFPRTYALWAEGGDAS